ncbi:uncharacterized protein LOC128677576 isoform X2 [Plodia interpunctella]|uniref:uncharacterized protein LOC128677576 isoform X2 n=1 Tax=Plodia interpunctella TaxID=58824 RepID=UPI002367ED1D|nr:uncharacterized protein LOC128677576 isoform X2 [Plodia interpunctella]
MINIPDNVRQDIMRLVPSSIFNEISCFVYYDNHPRDDKFIDITVCTKSGEVKEFHQRELVSEVYLECPAIATEIKIMRNSECKLFYVITADDNLIILSRRDKLCIHRLVDNVERYDIEDSLCQGEAFLKIVRKDDAVPLIFDDNYESLGDKAQLLSSIRVEETPPVLMDLKRKLVEAKYSVKCNESTYREYLNLRQLAAFSMYRKIHPNLDESVFKSGSKEMAGALKIKTHNPWVKLCNEKVVIAFNIINENEQLLEDVHILLHVKNKSSIVYRTRLFERLPSSPYWKERDSYTIEETEVAITAVVDLKEIKETVLSRVDFTGVLVYQRGGQEFLLPFDNTALSANDTMGEEFDVLSSGVIDEQTILAILATTEKTSLILRHIRKEDESLLDIPAVLASHLHMQQNGTNVIVNRTSPYHPLNGIMCVFSEPKDPLKSCYDLSIHTRYNTVNNFHYCVHHLLTHKACRICKFGL